jgi:hypothetical protein
MSMSSRIATHVGSEGSSLGRFVPEVPGGAVVARVVAGVVAGGTVVGLASTGAVVEGPVGSGLVRTGAVDGGGGTVAGSEVVTRRGTVVVVAVTRTEIGWFLAWPGSRPTPASEPTMTMQATTVNQRKKRLPEAMGS